MRKRFVFLFQLFSLALCAQTQIAFQGFESGDNWTIITGNSNISSNVGAGDTPPNQRILSGTYSWQVNNGNKTLELANVSIVGYSNVKVTIRLSSTATDSGNGVNENDHMRISVALNNGSYPGSPDIDITGPDDDDDDALWGYNAFLVASTTAGTPVTFHAPQDGLSTNNYATAVVNIPNGNNSVKLKIQAINTNNPEYWNVDNIELSGDLDCTPPTVQASGFSATAITPNSMTINWTRGNGDNVLVLARQGSPVNADPTDGASYAANANYGSGQQVGSGNYAVYAGSGSSVNVTGLSANTVYYFALYEFKTNGNCYNLAELTGNAQTYTTAAFAVSTSSVTEGNSGTTALNVTVTLAGNPASNVVVNIADVLSGTATANVDYTFSSPATLTFTPGGALTQQTTITVIGDTEYEYDETVGLSLAVASGPAAVGAIATHTATILNDDAAIFYSTGNADFFTGSFWASSPTGPGTFSYPAVGNAAYFVVQTGHTVTINSGNVTANGIVVNGYLDLANTTTSLTINNGTSGPDLTVSGTFRDNGNSASGTFFGAGATWTLSAFATFIKTNNSGAARYRDYYDGGMSTIPASANWILRYTTPGNHPTLTTDGSYYPNLIIESVSGLWDPSGADSRFSGSATPPTIKGDLDVGGSGTGMVVFYNQNTHTTPVLIQGSLIVRSGSTFRNNPAPNGTGVRLDGDIWIEGTLNFSGGSANAGVIELTGSYNQDIYGAGDIFLRNLTLNKPAGLAILDRYLTVNNLLTLISGLLQINDYDLTIAPSGLAIAGGSNVSYVNTNSYGVLIQTLNFNITKKFPVGNSTYNPVTLSNNELGDVYKVRVVDAVYQDGETGQEYTNSVVDRTWMIDSDDPGTELLSMTLQWEPAHEMPGFIRTACYVSHYFGGGWNGDTPGAASGSNPYTRSRSGITSLSPFALASSGQLPVELLAFRGERVDGQAHLSWETATERDNAYFAVERGTLGGTFVEIGRVTGAGTTAVRQEYAFIDRQPRPGANLYRLRQVDFNGEYAYSPVVALQFDAAGSGTRIYPSPVSTELTLEIHTTSPETIPWAAYDASGRRILEGSLAPETGITILNVSNLPAGLFWLQLTRGMDVESFKFVKN